MRLAEEGQQMVLAHRIKLNVLHDHHLVVIHIEQRAVQHFLYG